MNRVLMLGVAVCAVLPSLTIAGNAVPVLYLFIPLLIPMIFIVSGGIRVRLPRVIRVFGWFWLLILVQVFVSSVFGAPMLGYKSRLSLEVVQYLARSAYFLSFAVWFYKKEINARMLLVTYLIMMFLAMAVGVLQYIPWSGANTLAKIYTFSEDHFDLATRDALSSKRVPGIAFFATSNGGLAAFAFAIAVGVVLFHRRWFLAGLVLALFAIGNTIASHARMGYLTILFVMVVYYLVWVALTRRFVQPTLVLGSIIASIGVTVLLLYSGGNPWIHSAVNRWISLFDQVSVGGNRIGQLLALPEYMGSLYTYLFGISRSVQTSISGLYMEMEPANIFLLYGVIGVILQYGLIAFLLVYLGRSLRQVRDNHQVLATAVISFVGLLGYQFFSLAYYFFREIYVGVIPWIFFGGTVGLIERHRLKKKVYVASSSGWCSDELDLPGSGGA